MEEIFKEVPGCPGYLASERGTILSTKRGGKVLTKFKSKLGYSLVMLYNDGRMRQAFVARMVLSAFRGFPADPWLCVANNIDGDLENCSIDNLEWIVCKTTEEYDPSVSHRRGVLKPEVTKTRMTVAKLNQSEETKRKGAETRRRTCAMRNR